MLLAPSRLQVRYIGHFALTDVSGAPRVVRNRRARALFAYLAFHPRQADVRGKLCGLLWGDRAEPQARASLRQCLSELRAVLPDEARDCVLVERETVRLDPAGIESDVSALRAALAEAQPQVLAGPLRGAGASRLLEDVELGGPFSEWLEAMRGQVDRELAQGVRRLIKVSATQQDWEAVREVGDAYIARDPIDEAVIAALIRADCALGDRAAGRRRLEELRSALAKDYGFQPGEEVLAAALTLAAPARPGPTSPATQAARSSGLPTVAVAEIDSSQLQGESRHFGGVMRGEIIAAMSGFREFRVAAAPLHPGQRNAEGLLQSGADYVLGGVLWGSGESTRLTAQLMRACDQQVIWSERIAVRYADITNAVDHVVLTMIGAVSPSIDADLQASHMVGLDDRYTRYAVARGAAASPPTYEAARQAAADLEGLIAEDPDFILPYLPLARLYNNDFAYTRPLSSGPEERARAFMLARAALSRDRSHIHAYTVVGWCHLREGQWAAAQAHFEQALSLNPYHADRVMEVGYGYLLLGEVERAAELLHRCLMLNPTPKDSYYIDLALLEIIRGDYDRSAAFVDLVASPMTWSLLYNAMCATLRGRPERKLSGAFLERARSLWPPDLAFTPEALLKWVIGDHPFAPTDLRTWFLDAVRATLF